MDLVTHEVGEGIRYYWTMSPYIGSWLKVSTAFSSAIKYIVLVLGLETAVRIAMPMRLMQTM